MGISYKNVEVLKDNGCPTCGNWTKHWEKWQGIKMPKIYSNKDWSAPIFPIVGGLSKRSMNEKSHQWIIPQCTKYCKSSNSSCFDIRDEKLKVSYDNCFYQKASPKLNQLQKSLDEIIDLKNDEEVKELVSKFNKDIDILIKK